MVERAVLMIGWDRYSPAYYLEEQPKPDTISRSGVFLCVQGVLPGNSGLQLCLDIAARRLRQEKSDFSIQY